MAAAQHTPGPWAYGVQDSDQDHTCVATIHCVPTLPTEDGKGQRYGVISARKPCFECSEDEHLANAILMAAAPDLLEALRDVVRVADRRTVEFDRAHAAIARAEGR